MSRIPIGLELFSVRNELAEDVRGTIKAVAEMGYEGVEFAGPPQHSAQALKGYIGRVRFGLLWLAHTVQSRSGRYPRCHD